MKRTRSLSEFSCLSEYTRLYPSLASQWPALSDELHRTKLELEYMQMVY